MSDNGTVMDSNFVPTRRGRKPLVNINEILDKVTSARGQWVKWDLRDPEANSALRQLAKVTWVETASERLDEGRRSIFVRAHGGDKR